MTFALTQTQGEKLFEKARIIKEMKNQVIWVENCGKAWRLQDYL